MVNNIFAKRFQRLRLENKIPQDELAKKLSEIEDRQKDLTASTISAWETGRKMPSTVVLLTIADYFGVTTDYLLGKSDSKTSKIEKQAEEEIENSEEIMYKDLYAYDGIPIYVVFKTLDQKNQWGIYNHSERKLIFKDMHLDIKNRISSFCEFYVKKPDYEENALRKNRSITDIDQLKKYDHVYILMKTSDDYMRGMYSGWYHHSIDRECLINDLGAILRYEGLDVYYKAYTKAID